MSDELTPNERATLDSWTPMQPPSDFADRVLAARTQVPARSRSYRWVAALGAVAVAAVAVIAVVSVRTERMTDAAMEPTAAQTAPTIALEEARSEENSAAVAPITTATSPTPAPSQDSLIPPPLPRTNVVVDVSVHAGESFTIHVTDERQDVQVRVVGPSCAPPTEGRAAILAVPVGHTKRYEASCVDGTNLVSGSFRAIVDAATGTPDATSPLQLVEVTQRGGAVAVNGAVDAGWVLTSDGVEIPVASGRFAATVPAGVPLRAAHPQRGIHYYLLSSRVAVTDGRVRLLIHSTRKTPIANAAIAIEPGGFKLRSDASGRASVNVPPGDYTIRATTTDGSSTSLKARVAPGDNELVIVHGSEFAR